MRNLKTIQKQIEGVIRVSQDYPFQVDAEEITKDWYSAKKPYIKAFGGETSILVEEDISIELDETQQARRFKSFIADIYEDDDICEAQAEDGSWFIHFLQNNEKGFFENKVVVEYPALKIKKGMKLLKAFKFFLSDFNTCRKAQDMASRYIQTTKITGDLYLSVDPLDFLSLSENNNNWRSCHSLDGEYRAGNINYMLDDTTLMAFLAPKELTQLKSFPLGLHWNNKKWRMLIHTKQFKDICYYNRQYPFDDDGLLTKVYKKLCFISNWNLQYPTKIGIKQVKVGNELINLEYNYIYGESDRLYDSREVIDDSGFLGYSDLKYSPYYDLTVSQGSNYEYYSRVCQSENIDDWDEAFHDYFDITIGEKFKCLKCGDQYVERGDSFLCDYCIAEEDLDEDNFFRCSRCGRRLYNIDEATTIDGEVVCENCADAIQLPLIRRRYTQEVDINGN